MTQKLLVILLAISPGLVSAAEPHPDYAALKSQCQGSACCEASVREMESLKAIIHEPNKPCPQGYTPNMYRCKGSLSWCEPAPVKNPKAEGTPHE